MNLHNLESFLLNNKIPVSKRNIGFLEIIGKPHDENIISSIYAHFINSSDETVRSLFLDTLVELVSKKSKKTLNFENAKARKEVRTQKGRIDILITDTKSKSAIIIENKIYHGLHNNLNEYWDHVKHSDDYKVGVLLTLYPKSVPIKVDQKYVNITHKEWMELVKEKYVSSAPLSKYDLYIKDFIQTMEYLTYDFIMNDSVDFYFKNLKKINQLISIRESADNYIDSQLKVIAEEIGFKTYGQSMNWRNFLINDWDEICLTIILEGLFDGTMQFSLIIELFDNMIKMVDDLARDFTKNPLLKSDMKISTKIKGSYSHFVSKSYHIELKDLSNFSKFVIVKIKDDFSELFVEIYKYLYPNKELKSLSKLMGLKKYF